MSHLLLIRCGNERNRLLTQIIYENKNVDTTDINLQVGFHIVLFDQKEHQKYGHSIGL